MFLGTKEVDNNFFRHAAIHLHVPEVISFIVLRRLDRKDIVIVKKKLDCGNLSLFASYAMLMRPRNLKTDRKSVV